MLFRSVRPVVVDGCFDPLHVGHLRYFDAARPYGPLLCVVEQDAAGIGLEEAGERVQRKSLTGAAGPKQDGDAGGARQGHVQLKSRGGPGRGEPLSQGEFQLGQDKSFRSDGEGREQPLRNPYGSRSPWSRLVTYRMTMAVIEMTRTIRLAGSMLPDWTVS